MPTTSAIPSSSPGGSADVIVFDEDLHFSTNSSDKLCQHELRAGITLKVLNMLCGAPELEPTPLQDEWTMSCENSMHAI
ncbi:unnamed protein product [Allacma fusca]|uniref:Uncharacterized protein n=1 Tax=Allacma fusca TaxID=39272 RepID=A0A8J2KP41_9HEXA|nr:unnamed protein product [Allacma fusca]